MNDFEYALRAAEVLRHRPIAVRETALSRDEGVSLVAQAIERKTRHTASKHFLWAGAASAAALSVAGWWAIASYRPFEGPVATLAASCSPTSPCTGGTAISRDPGMADGHPFVPGSRISAANDRATNIDLSSGTHLALAAGGLLSYDEGSDIHRFSLLSGAVHLEVRKLLAQQRFLVNTPDTEVEVRGTIFDVGWQPTPDRCGHQTSVHVTEGSVEVRGHGRSLRLTAGQSWPEPCAVTQAAAIRSNHLPAPKAQASAGAPQPMSVVASLPTGDSPSSPQTSPSLEQTYSSAKRASDLAEQNDLFGRASAARRNGDTRLAIQLYDELLSRFPQTPLAESANSSRLGLLRSSDPTRARSEAKRYLKAYPAGFSRNLAESILKEQ